MIKSYVLRNGRKTHRQTRGLEQLLSNYCLPIQEKNWDIAQFFGREAKTIVEIGFGMGASLLLMAERYPEINFIGIEVHAAGIGGFAANLYEHDIKNVRIVTLDAVTIFKTQLEKNSISGIQIFFPDPWPKKKHHKRRLLQKSFVPLLVDTLSPGGFIHCATDWENYAQSMLKLLMEEPLLRNHDPKGGYAPRPSSRPITKFEARGHMLGHAIYDLIFYKNLKQR